MMDFLIFFQHLNTLTALPATILFFVVACLLTLKTRFVQIRGFKRFLHIVRHGTSEARGNMRTMNPFHAMFTAMASTIGMGNIVGPSIAIYIGGPGALFWLLLYIILGSVAKFVEVTFALHTRTKTADGNIIGGPMQYLKLISPALSLWWMSIMSLLFMGWSAVQTNTLANVFAQESVPLWITGLACAVITFVVLYGGAQRVGNIASKLVPLMFVLYVSFSVYILATHWPLLKNAFTLIMRGITNPSAAIGGFIGTTLFKSIQCGFYRGIFITEAGLGTSSIPHAIADTKKPTDQGLLAMYSMSADMFLSALSGLLILTTGVWNCGDFRSTLVYEAFKMNAPIIGQWALLASISLFVITTIIGNSFNGSRSFAALTHYQGMRWYIACTLMVMMVGSISKAALVWEIMDTMLTLVAIPNLIGILILAYKYPRVLDIAN